MEMLGCYFPQMILNDGKSHWLWIPTAISLLAFVLLLTLHPAASGRIYAAYGGIYVASALVWLKIVDRKYLTYYDIIGGVIVVTGALVIICQPDGFVHQDYDGL